MTVRELIEHLQTLPQDFPVIYQNCSDYSTMEARQITVQRSTEKLQSDTAVPHHNMPGEYRRFRGPFEYPGGNLPTPADVVIFPGN